MFYQLQAAWKTKKMPPRKVGGGVLALDRKIATKNKWVALKVTLQKSAQKKFG
jgi:hypothetical protein